MNAYKIYETIYEEEVAKKTPNLPPKWTHARFLEELVYDFVFPGRSRTKSSADTASTGSSARSFSMSYRDGDDGEDVYDLRSSGGRNDYCRNIKPKREKTPNTPHLLIGALIAHTRICRYPRTSPKYPNLPKKWSFCLLFAQFKTPISFSIG